MGGLALEVVDGGIMENVRISNILIEGPQVPFFIRLGNRARKYADTAAAPSVGRIRNIRLSHITATGADETGCSVTGIRESPLEDIFLNDIHIETQGSDSAFSLTQSVPEKEAAYPEGTMFGRLPAYGLYIRNAEGVHLSGISICSCTRETRPGITLVRTRHFSLSGLDIGSVRQTKALVYIAHCRDGAVTANGLYRPAQNFVLKDPYSKQITIAGGNF
jgi:hypothetical protein